MKIIYKNPEWIESRINELEYRLSEIQKEYLAELEKASTIFHRGINFEDDYRVQNIRKQITYCLLVSAPTMIVTVESEEEKERLKGLLEKGETE